MIKFLLFLYRITKNPWHPILYLLSLTLIFFACDGSRVLEGRYWRSSTEFWISISIFSLLWIFLIRFLIKKIIMLILAVLTSIFKVNLFERSNLFFIPKKKLLTLDDESCEQMFIKKNYQEIRENSGNSNSPIKLDLLEMLGRKEKYVSIDVIIMKISEFLCYALFDQYIDINKSNRIFNKYIIERYCQNVANLNLEDSINFVVGAAVYAKNQRLNYLVKDPSNAHLKFMLEWLGIHPRIMDQAFDDINNLIFELKKSERGMNEEFVTNLIGLRKLLITQIQLTKDLQKIKLPN